MFSGSVLKRGSWEWYSLSPRVFKDNLPMLRDFQEFPSEVCFFVGVFWDRLPPDRSTLLCLCPLDVNLGCLLGDSHPALGDPTALAGGGLWRSSQREESCTHSNCAWRPLSEPHRTLHSPPAWALSRFLLSYLPAAAPAPFFFSFTFCLFVCLRL